MQAATTNDRIKTDQEIIENFHSEMRRQFAEMYIKQKPTLREIQQQQKAEAVAKIKDILFARLLIRLIKNNSATEPLVIDLQALREAL